MTNFLKQMKRTQRIVDAVSAALDQVHKKNLDVEEATEFVYTAAVKAVPDCTSDEVAAVMIMRASASREEAKDILERREIDLAALRISQKFGSGDPSEIFGDVFSRALAANDPDAIMLDRRNALDTHALAKSQIAR